jgi:hypothetical protein
LIFARPDVQNLRLAETPRVSSGSGEDWGGAEEAVGQMEGGQEKVGDV